MDILSVFREATTQAGKLQLKLQPHVTKLINKGEGDFATKGDIEGGKLMRDIIKRKLPNIPILSEEENPTQVPGPTFIVMDDLDATVCYQAQCAEWGPLLGYVQDGVLTHACMYMPSRDVMFTAELGKGCFRNAERVQLSQDIRLTDSMMHIIFNKATPRSFHDQVSTLLAYRANGVRDLNSNIGGVVEVLEGRCCGSINLIAHIWDLPGMLCITEAGGIALHPNGKALTWDKIPMSHMIAANKDVAQEILAISSTYSEYDKHSWI